MTDKSTQSTNEIRRMWNSFHRYDRKGIRGVATQRVQGGQDRTRKQNNNYIHCETRQRGKRTIVHKIHVNKEKVR